jgi:hypothetical protein
MTGPDTDEARLRALLSASGLADAATSVAAQPPAAEVDAEHAVAFRIAQSGVVVSVYAFADLDHLAIGEHALRSSTCQGRTAVTSSDGTMLLYATGDTGDAESARVLSSLQTDFAADR